MSKTVLITGVAGLLGSRLADWIIENKPEYKVVGIDDLSGGYESNVHPKVDLWEIDLVKHPISFTLLHMLLKDLVLLYVVLTMITT